MRTLVLLVLFVTLVFTEGWDNIRPSRDRRSNKEPCQKSSDNNAYNKFLSKHILQDVFNTNSEPDWVNYLTKKGLCGRTAKQSFLRSADSNKIKDICNGQGTKVENNLCISQNKFDVYIVESSNDKGKCKVTRYPNKQYYVTVACDNVDNQCLPVHYQTQTETEPTSRGTICKP